MRQKRRPVIGCDGPRPCNSSGKARIIHADFWCIWRISIRDQGEIGAVKRLSLQNAKQISNLVKPHDARVVKGVILMLHGFYPATAIYVLEIAFWAPFLFLPVAASGMVDDQACANTLFDTAAFAVIEAYFHLYFPVIRLSSSIVLGFGAFIAKGISLAHVFNNILTMLAFIDTNREEAVVNGTCNAKTYLLRALSLSALSPLVIRWRKRLIWQPSKALPGTLLGSLSGLFIVTSPTVSHGALNFGLCLKAKRALPEPLGRVSW